MLKKSSKDFLHITTVAKNKLVRREWLWWVGDTWANKPNCLLYAWSKWTEIWLSIKALTVFSTIFSSLCRFVFISIHCRYIHSCVQERDGKVKEKGRFLVTDVEFHRSGRANNRKDAFTAIILHCSFLFLPLKILFMQKSLNTRKKE